MKPCSVTTGNDAAFLKCKFRFSVARIGAVVLVLGFALLNCANDRNTVDSENDVTSSVRVVAANIPIPKGGGTHRVGDPYVIAGRTYTPREDPNYRAEGMASWYGERFHGRLTANGEIFDMHAVSAAHPTLPLPSYVRITNLENRRSLIVRLNDRGPYRNSRLIDVSVKTAKLLGFYDQGIAQVRVDYIGPAELEGSDDDMLSATLRYDDLHAMEMSESMVVQRSQTSTTSSRSDDADANTSSSAMSQIEIPH